MTKILLTGITLAVMLFALGSSAQGFALPMPENTQANILGYTLEKNTTLDNQLMLVSNAPKTKGDMATFYLIPRPQTNVDGIVIPQTDSTQLILANIPTIGGKTMLKLISKPQEGIDGITIPKPILSTGDVIQTRSALPETVLTSVTTSGSTILKLMPKTQESIDGITFLPPAGDPMMLVSEPITSKGEVAVLHLVPKPVPNSMDSTS
ncbi:MAG: hypothetical protein KGH85_05770 [Thaumarchaeota archaeon]|nr:hypothetical protein [Nitrososphaerota archaeon]